MRNLICAAALLAIPALPASAAEPVPATMLAGPVVYEARSWGSLLIRWQVNPDGSGEIWRGPRRRGGNRGEGGEVQKFRLRLEGEALATFVRNVEDVRTATRDGIPCDKDVHDLPYGSITWDYPGAKQTFSFDAGCRSEETDEVMDVIGAANSNVENLAKIEAKPYITERVENR